MSLLELKFNYRFSVGSLILITKHKDSPIDMENVIELVSVGTFTKMWKFRNNKIELTIRNLQHNTNQYFINHNHHIQRNWWDQVQWNFSTSFPRDSIELYLDDRSYCRVLSDNFVITLMYLLSFRAALNVVSGTNHFTEFLSLQAWEKYPRRYQNRVT